MNVLVTGATGLLGSHVLSEGQNRGHKLTAFARKISSKSFLGQSKHSVDIIETDLLNGDIAPEVFNNIHAVIHCAALASADPKDKELMEKLNYHSAKSLFEKAKAAGVAHWVQISTTAVLTGHEKNVSTEIDFGNLRPTPYAETKFKFDQYLVEQEKDPSNTQILSIHPGYILGQWDSKPSSGYVLFALRMGGIKAYVESQKNFVAASDVAIGIWQALESKVRGRFILGGHNLAISEFLKIAAIELNVKIPETQVKLSDLEQIPEPQRSFIREFCASGAVSSEKAKGAFGYAPQKSVSQMVKESVDYFTDVKMLKRAKR